MNEEITEKITNDAIKFVNNLVGGCEGDPMGIKKNFLGGSKKFVLFQFSFL